MFRKSSRKTKGGDNNNNSNSTSNSSSNSGKGRTSQSKANSKSKIMKGAALKSNNAATATGSAPTSASASPSAPTSAKEPAVKGNRSNEDEEDGVLSEEDTEFGSHHGGGPTIEELREETVDALKVEEWHHQGLSVIIFGASGDLAKKKTYPALFALYKSGSLSEHSIVCGYARSSKTDEEFRSHLKPYLVKEMPSAMEEQIDAFLQLCIYRCGPYDSADDFARVSKELSEKQKGFERENRVFYLALPPSQFVPTVSSMKQAMLSVDGYNRVVVEKPFGHDTESARKLGKELGSLLDERMTYRIDHYLGKEMVQNLIVLRFGNTFLEPLWNRHYVSAVQITFKEDIGTMGRGGYFDTMGIIRDVMQNHLMQILSIVAMERPVKVAGEDYSDYVRDEKVKVLRCIKPPKLSECVLGQYVANPEVGEAGYLDDDTVPDDSTTPTFCTAIFYINNPRWNGVPFIMKAGKALDNRRAEIRVQMKPPVGAEDLFNGEAPPQNEFVIRLQPKEAIYMKTNVKKPGLHTVPIQSELDLTYESRYPIEELHDAYTRLLLDVLRGKQATFVRNDELIAAWEIFTPLLQEIEASKIKPIPYKFGTRGPQESDDLVKRVGFTRNADYKRQWEEAQEQKAALTSNM